MYVVKYLVLVHMAEMHLQARASLQYELVPNILNIHSITYNYYIPRKLFHSNCIGENIQWISVLPQSRKVLSYCTGLRNVLSYCTGLRRGIPDRTTFARWSP